MKIVKQFTLIVAIMFIGKWLIEVTGIPMPANVLGMIILLIALVTGVLKEKDIKDTSDFIISHLSLFFVVPSVGIILYLDLFTKSFFKLMIPLLGSILLGLFVCGKVVEGVILLQDRNKLKKDERKEGFRT